MLTLYNKQNLFKIRNTFLFVYSLLFVAGIVFGTVMSVRMEPDEIKQVCDSFINSLSEPKMFLILDHFLFMSMITLMLWSVCMMFSLWWVTSPLRVLVSFVTGICAGLASTSVIYGLGIPGVVYTACYIVPVSLVRFLVWYVFLKSMGNIHKSNLKPCRLTNDDDGCMKSIIMLFIIVFTDVLSGALSVAFANTIF